MDLNYFLLDVFTSQPFGGNPLAVFPDAEGVPASAMQAIANELNLSETTFIQKRRSAGSDCTVRIFTPRQELPVAGHPTIGTAYAVLKHRLLEPANSDRLVFDEGIGAISVEFERRESGPAGLWMHLPVPEFREVLEKKTVARLLSLGEREISADYPVQVVSSGLPVVLVPLNSLDSVRNASVRAERLESELRHIDCKEFLVFTRETENPESSVHCRVFAPRLGIPEDPATGSAHGPLGGYLFRHGLSEGSRIVSEQGLEMGRPSRIEVRVRARGEEITDILVGGDCVEVGTGSMRLPG